MKMVVLRLGLACLFMTSAEAQNLAESTIIANYDDVIGTAPRGQTISAAGAAVEETQNGAQAYGFFTQTLANDIYYEVRAYGRYNYLAQNPLFPTVDVSNINNPMGYGFAGFLGYNFHPNELVDITPYVRLNYLKNMSVVYEDSNGNFINSSTVTEMLGAKFAFKVIKGFTPCFNFSAGLQQLQLTGNFDSGPTPNTNLYSTVDQVITIAEIGFNFKVSQSSSLIPYWQYITSANNPDSVAKAPYDQGGFNISSLTSTQQAIGLKFSTAW